MRPEMTAKVPSSALPCASTELNVTCLLVFVQAGLLFTVAFVPNIMTLDLREGDRRFDALMLGKPENYTGDATHPKNLSLFERYFLKYGRFYNEGADAKARKEEGIRSSGSLPAGHA